MAYPDEAYKKLSDYDKPLTNLKKEYFPTSTGKTSNTENTNKINEEFSLKTGQGLTEFFI